MATAAASTVASAAPTRPNHATRGTISATVTASRTRFKPNSARVSARTRSTASTAMTGSSKPSDDTMKTGTLAAYRSVNSSTMKGWAVTTRSPTIGANRSASFRVLSCQTATAAPSRPAPRCSLIRTIITLSTDAVATSTSGICRHPTA